MSDNEKKPENEQEKPIQSPEHPDIDDGFEKKELSKEEEKEIFGEEEKTEKEEILEIYRDKKPYEIEFHKEFSLFPDEWIQEEVVKLMQSDHALIRNWNEVNDWIREIAVKLNSGVLIAKKVNEFCSEQCANPQLIDRHIYGFVDDKEKPLEEQVWTHAVIDCLSCPLYPYGTVNAFEHRPDETYSEVKLGKLVKEPETEATEDEEKVSEETDSDKTNSSDLS